MFTMGDSKPANHRPKSFLLCLGALPVLLFIGLVAVCRAYLTCTAVFEPPLLLPLLNTLFLACVPLGIAYFAGRIYLATGSLNILLIGCALLVFGVGNLVAGWGVGLAGPNRAVTIHNIASLAASILYVMAALAMADRSAEKTSRRRKTRLFFAYACILLFVVFLSAASFLRMTPAFFVAGKGPTLLREVVLSVAVILHVLSALFAIRLYWQRRAVFLYWLGLALLLTATGLAAIAMQTAVGSLIGWVGRVSQYLGAVYFFVAARVMVREARMAGTTIEETLASFFRQSELRYKNLVDAARVAIVSTDAQGQIILWNPAAEAIFGFTQHEAVGSRLTDLIGLDNSLVGSFDDEGSAEGSAKAVGATLKRKDGSILYSEISASLAEIEGGKIVTFIVSDITGRKLIEEALEKERDFVSAVLDTEGALVVVLDREARITRFNRACQEITGYSATEVLGRVFWGFLVPPEELAGVKETWEALKTGDFPNTHENHWLAKDGSRRLIAWSNTALAGATAELEYIIGTGIDVTEHRQAEEFLRESEERFRVIASSTPDHLFVQDHELRYTLVVNPQLGHTEQQMIGKTDYDLLPREDADRLTRIKREVLETGRPVHVEVPLFSSKGEEEFFDGSCIPRLNARGQVDGLIGYFKNVTEHKLHELRITRLSKLYSMLSRVNEAIVRTHDEITLYNDVCRIVSEEGAFSLVWIGQVRGKEVVPVVSCGPATDYLKEIRVSVEGTLGAGPTGTCIREDRPVVNYDFDTNPLTAPWREPALRHGFRASAAFPLHRQGRGVGALTLYASDRGAFEPEQVHLLEALAADISYALDTMEQEQLRARAEFALQHSLRRFELLARTASELLRAAEPQKVVNALCHEAMEYLDCHTFFNFLVVEGFGKLRLNAYAGISDEDARKIGWLDFGAAEHIPTTPDERTELAKPFGIKAYASHPMIAPGGKVIGTLSFGTRSRETFSEEDLSLMKAVTDLVAVAMVRMAGQQALQRARDELEERVMERTATLARVNEELRKEIAERSLVEKALYESNELLERVFSSIDLAIAYMDRDFNLIRVNRAYAQADEREPSFYPGKNHFSLFPNEENEAIFRSVVETGEPYYAHERPFAYAEHPERGLTYWDWSLHPVRERDGRVGGVVLSLVDVTARRRAQDELRQNEELLRQVLNLLPVGVWITDRNGKIILGNPAGQKIWAGARYVGIDQFGEYKAWWAKTGKLLEPEEWAVARAITKGETSLDEELEIACFDGTRKVILNSALPIRNTENEIVAAIVVNQDITERKAAEQELLRLVTAMEQTAEGIAILGVDRSILYVNPAFESINERARQDVLGRGYDEIVGAGDKGIGIKGEISGMWTCHLIRTRKDGGTRELDVTISPVTDPSGATINYVVLERDVTQEVRLQQHMRQVQKMEALGTLAGGIAHDFNNILMPILINTEMALQDVMEARPISHYLQVVLEAANRGRELTKQITTFTRQREEAKAPMEVAPIIQEALKFLRASIPRNIEIRDRIDAIPGVVLGDPTQMQQVLMNLCSNAAYAMRESGGILEVKLAAVDVSGEISAERVDLKPGSYVKLSVTDTGRGMDRETLERAFDPFFTTKPPGEGTGLGLALVHGIAKNHGGTVTAYSEKGKGSTFTVFLPLIAGDRIPERPLPGPIPKGGERILLIDDEEIQIRSVKPMLEKLGYKVVGKTSAPDALELFRAQPAAFDLVITDQTMPQMVGHELAKELLRIRPDVPVILCTGFSEVLHEEQIKAAGIREFVMKPFSVAEIAERIRRALGKIS